MIAVLRPAECKIRRPARAGLRQRPRRRLRPACGCGQGRARQGECQWPPDIFASGNHEFDFSKATFLQRMAEAKFPLRKACGILERLGVDRVVIDAS
jgi:hypothetical protein